MIPNDFRPMSERIQSERATVSGSRRGAGTDDVVRELQAVADSLPATEALLLPRKRVWDRLAAEVSSEPGRARGAA